jgi:hypothetical protein
MWIERNQKSAMHYCLSISEKTLGKIGDLNLTFAWVANSHYYPVTPEGSHRSSEFDPHLQDRGREHPRWKEEGRWDSEVAVAVKGEGWGLE